ncbi:4-hydroxybutyrate dehydrogenase/sulfolactaldehyde 3-reductase [Cricetibacter osteomyelitidis]|uniref:4-hydroxybutyrate dehydrogenase/sulfolactaldehyde 3-reductase n=1 Tax=Cricetibacter osteomyelitidis TaxID=1521931 RepID=A0A4R2TFI6_9PAST|nr:sulfolactaldehyde 3-reductase [Cricetibacter osteomyelitidis]TCP93472.1 4-hydroxybutyrate dehydrogenase/sulfolactaldehyde 3-reductase [Cricetibacter osteomyelitidis]
MAKIAFIGLGQMGSPMATNLLKKGHFVSVYDINPEAVKKLTAIGAQTSSTLGEVVQGCEFIITMLPNGKLVEQVIFGEQGFVNAIATNALVIDMSTIHPFESDRIREKLGQLNIEFMDAPVGRTSDNAIAGTLLILAGGTSEQVSRATEVLLCMGSEIINTGGPGRGIRVKLINNFMSISLNALSAETATLCEALNLPFDIAMRVMQGTPANKGHFTTTWVNKVLKGDLSPAFMIDLAHKDLGIALDVANQLHVPLVMGAASREIYSQAKAMGRGKQDWTAILEHVRFCSGLIK